MLRPAIYFTDLHVNKYNQFSEHRDRLADCLKVIDDVFKYAAHYEADTILFGGDMADLPKYVYIQVVSQLLSRLAKWFNKYPNVTMYGISGNHDQNKKNYWDNPADTFITVLATAFPGRFICIDNQRIELSDSEYICGIPYYENKSCFDKALDSMHERILKLRRTNETCKVTLLIHQTPEGIFNKHIRSETSPADPRYEVFDMVWDGHIHQMQVILDKFIVGGNPLHRDLGDIGQDKGIWLTDLANLTDNTFISRKGRYPEFKRVKSVDITDQMQQSDFIVPIREDKEVVVEGSADTTQFAANLNPEILLINFWKATEGTDEKLLTIGLQLLQP